MDQAAVKITLSASGNVPTFTAGPFVSGVAQLNTREAVAGWFDDYITEIGGCGERVDIAMGGNYAQLSDTTLSILTHGGWLQALRNAGGSLDGALVQVGTLTAGGVFTAQWSGYSVAMGWDGLTARLTVENVISRRHKTVPKSFVSGDGISTTATPLVYGTDVETKLVVIGGGQQYIDIGATSTMYHYDRAKPTNYRDTHFGSAPYYTSAVLEQTQLSYTTQDENIKITGTVGSGSVAITRDIVSLDDRNFIINSPWADQLPRVATIDSAFDWESRIAEGNLFFEVDDGTNKVYVKITSYLTTNSTAPLDQMDTVVSNVNYNNFGDVFYDGVGNWAGVLSSTRTRTFGVFPATASATGTVKLFSAETIVSSDSDSFGITLANGLYVPFTETSAGSKQWQAWNYALGNLALYTCPWVKAIALSGSNPDVISDGTSATSFSINAYYSQEDTPAFAALFPMKTDALANATDVFFFIDASMTKTNTDPIRNHGLGIKAHFKYIDESGTIFSSQSVTVVSDSTPNLGAISFNNYPESSEYDSGSFSGFESNQIKLTIPAGTTNIRVYLGCGPAFGAQPGDDINVLGSMTVRQMTLVPVFGPIWETITSGTTNTTTGRTIGAEWPDPALSGDAYGDVIDDSPRIMLDIYHSQLGLGLDAVDAASWNGIARTGEYVISSADRSENIIAQLAADSDTIVYHKRDGKEAIRRLFAKIGTTNYDWIAEPVYDSGRIDPQPITAIAPSPELDWGRDWVTNQPLHKSIVVDPSVIPTALTASNWGIYCPGYTEYALATEAQNITNNGYKLHGLSDRKIVTAMSWPDAAGALDNYFVGSDYTISRLEWITRRKDVYSCELDYINFPSTACVGDHVKITDPFMGDMIGTIVDWAWKPLEETVSLTMLLDPPTVQNDVINVLVSSTDQINVQITDTNIINVQI
jgi:hypothetical protein